MVVDTVERFALIRFRNYSMRSGKQINVILSFYIFVLTPR